MFERFTDNARQVVVLAQEQSRERHADAIRTEHLLLALYRVPGNLALTVLDGHSVRREDVEADVDALRPHGPVDAEALATLGIDLDEVRRSVEETFGKGALDRPRSPRRGRWSTGHIPFERNAKKVLELGLREALRLGHDYIGCEHVLLGLLHAEGSARTVLLARGARLDTARVMVDELVRGRRAG